MLTCAQTIAIAAHCSDGQLFRSSVCMAIKPPSGDEQRSWYCNDELYVTPEAQQRLDDEHIWYHLGGFGDQGDTYDTQLYYFSKELEAFWLRLTGPDEPLRHRLLDCLSELVDWRSATILANGQVTLQLADGSQKILLPPQPAAEEVQS
jgi:hypothetical protein